MIKSYYFARFLRRLQIPSFRHCVIDKTARVAGGSSLTKVRMGRWSYVGSNTHITDAEIGSFCSIGGNSGVGGGIHPMEYASTSPVFLRGRNIFRKNFAQIPYEPSKKVIIGNDVWIGEGVYVMPGVTIGDGAVIGAHAVVTKDVSPYAVAAGVPAREIKKRFDEDTIAGLLESKWWEWTDAELKKAGDCFADPRKVIEAARRKTEAAK